ncbi:MAG: hypothetical protein ACI8RD_013948 [Bacillariaceae sp.]|jgi:hypothetical protein
MTIFYLAHFILGNAIVVVRLGSASAMNFSIFRDFEELFVSITCMWLIAFGNPSTKANES